jgi:ribonuclease D
LYDALIAELDRSERLAWLKEDCDLLVSNAKLPLDLHAFFPRIKSAWKLNAQQLAVLQALSYWREQTARERDMPRNHVVHERVLWNLAKYQPESPEELKRIEEMELRTLKRFGKDLLEVIAVARELPPESYPAALPAPLPLSERDLMKALKRKVAEAAAELKIEPEILVRKADYEAIIRSGMQGDYRLPDKLLGWRRAIIGETLVQLARDLSAKS